MTAKNSANSPVPGKKRDVFIGKGKKWKTVKQITAIEKSAAISSDVLYYLQLDAPPSLRPRHRYCDITGLPAKYTDPRTGLIYYNSDVYKFIQGLPHSTVQQYLALRGRAVELK